jgi:hypothetical protein
MAFVVSGLTDYTKEVKTDLLVKSMFSGKTASLLQGAGQVVPGIKSAEILPLLTSDVYFQTDGCGYTASGSTTISKRTLTVGKIKIEETLCPKTLETKYTQIGLAAGAPVDLGVFQEQIGNEKASKVAEALETSIWQGDSTGGSGNSGFFDGFLTILGDLGFGGAGDPIEGNPTTGGGYTQLTSLTSSNIDEAIAKIYSLIPAGVLGKEDVFIAMGTDTYRTYRAWLVSANLFHYDAVEATAMEIVDPISGIKIYGLHGMNGTNKIVAGRWSNFFIGTDMMNEEEDWKMWYSQDNDEVRFRASMKYGTQIAYPEEVVYFKLP